jgi:hypothetical protein
MPRFPIKRLMAFVAAVAFWFATFKMPDPTNRGIGPQLQLIMPLMILVSAGFAAIYFRGKRQAFWAGFFVGMLLVFGRLFRSPDLLLIAESWAGGIVSETQRDAFDLVKATFWLLLMLLFSAVQGLIASVVYEQSRTDNKRQR